MTDRQTIAAPEIKQAPDTIGEAFDDFMSAFEAFKETNDRAARARWRAGSPSDVVTDGEGGPHQRGARRPAARARPSSCCKQARPALGGAGAAPRRAASTRPPSRPMCAAATRRACRRSRRRRCSSGSGPDGGYLVPPETETEIRRRLADISPIRAHRRACARSRARCSRSPSPPPGSAAGWVAETDARAPRPPRRRSTELQFPTMELYAMPAATQTLLDDARRRYRQLDRRGDRYRLRRAGGRGLRRRRRRQQADAASSPIPTVDESGLGLGQDRLRADRRRRRASPADRPVRRAGRLDLCAEGRLSPERAAS